METYKETHYLPKKSDKDIATLFYNITDGEIMYSSTCGGGWFWSSENKKSNSDKKDFINKLIKLRE